MKRWISTFALVAATAACLALPPSALAQDFGFEAPAAVDDDELSAALRDLAERVLPSYRESDPERYLTTLTALQMAVDNFAAARDTRRALQQRLQEQNAWPAGRALALSVYTEARALEATENLPFAEAYARAFRETFGALGDLDVYELEDSFMAPVEPLRERLESILAELRGTGSVTLEQAVTLVQTWFVFDAYRSFGGLVGPLIAEENERRYSTEDVTIAVSGDASIEATLVRPRSRAAERMPALLEFTLDRSLEDPREAAAHGYASVLAVARIARDAEPRPREPFASDGDDARAAIDWIATQPWSDGRVAMQGEGYGGYVAWSVLKNPPPALAAIATSDPMAPGIDVPSSNRIMHNSAYRWLYGLFAAPDDELAADDAHWHALNEDWYRSGRPYREYAPMPGPARAVFQRWLNHPSYDRYWQKWLPFGEEFARIDIPVLTLTGYYSAGETGALYYFTQHHEHDAEADHTLLIGPFDSRTVEGGAAAWNRELPLDPVARIDPSELRYAWLEHVLKGAARPELLSAAVNLEVAGANEWRHEPSLDALESRRLRLYLAPLLGDAHRLTAQTSGEPTSLTYVRDIHDRSDAAWRPAQALVLNAIDAREGMLFVGEPFDEPVDLAGRLRGELDFTVNRYDVDLVMTLYELTAGGEYVKLFDPPFAFRASYATDRVRRRLLLNGVRQQLAWQSERMIGRRVAAGSRLVLVLGVNQRADQQINYGAGGEVSEESIDSAPAATEIRWHEGTFIEVPLAPPPVVAEVSARQ